MNSMFRSDLKSILKSKMFKIFTVIMFALGIIIPIILYNKDKTLPADGFIFVFLPVVCFIIAIISSLFSSSEYMDGIIRNKVVLGKSRKSIYLSNLFCWFICAIILTIIYVLPYILLSNILLEDAEMTTIKLIINILYSIFILFSFCSIFTLLNFVITNKMLGAIISLVSVVIVGIISLIIYSRLQEPPLYERYGYMDDGVIKYVDDAPNPNYIPEGGKRKILETIIDILPTGQVIELMERKIKYNVFAIYTIITIIITTLGGIIVFNKRDLV